VNGLSVPQFLREFEQDLPAVHRIITSQGGRFVLGVGRDEPYKNWSVATRWLAGLAAAHNPLMTNDGSVQGTLWFVHVCPVVLPGGAYSLGTFGIGETLSRDTVDGAGWVYQSAGVLRLEKLTDRQLALLYRGAEALGQFSDLEGFGLPIVEAYLAGLGIHAASQSGCRPFLESLDDRNGVHFFDGDPESSFQSLDPNTVRMPWSQAIETRTLLSRERLSSSAVMDVLGSPGAMSKALLDLAREQVPQ
jgi:glycosyltransferase involved in cell wall biosynthesis